MKNNLSKLPYIIAFFATTVRYYDYALFGLSASVIANNFMPPASNDDKLLNFFMIFSIAVAARPVGSLIFGYLGDKVGRVSSIKTTTLIAIFSSLFIAILPNYNTIGFAATIILASCRIAFIMSLAGEVDIIKIYISEKIGKKYRHLANGVISFSSQIGVLLAAFMYHITLNFEEISWLWRVNFIVGTVLGIIIFCLRKKMQENIYTKKIINDNFFQLLQQNKYKIIISTILNGGIGSSYNFLLIFLNTFLSSILKIITPNEAARNNVILVTIYSISCLISGFIADKVSTYKQISISLTATILTLLVITILSDYYNIFSFYLHAFLVLLVPIYMVPIQIKLQSIFETTIRVRMYSLTHSIGSMIFSSTVPFICMLLWKLTKINSIIYLFFITILLLMLISIYILRKNSYKNLFEERIELN